VRGSAASSASARNKAVARARSCGTGNWHASHRRPHRRDRRLPRTRGLARSPRASPAARDSHGSPRLAPPATTKSSYRCPARPRSEEQSGPLSGGRETLAPIRARRRDPRFRPAHPNSGTLSYPVPGPWPVARYRRQPSRCRGRPSPRSTPSSPRPTVRARYSRCNVKAAAAIDVWLAGLASARGRDRVRRDAD
jgi:hypothetical protein